MKKKYYDGFIVHDILDAHLKSGKMLEVLKAFAEVNGVDAVEVIRCKDCSFWDKEPSQTAMPEIHTCRNWRIGTTCVDYCARASKDRWMKSMPKEKET